MGFIILSMPYLFVFLGNPGPQYRQTRHNCGWMVCDRLTRVLPQPDNWQSKFHGLFAKRQDAVLLKPQTFMNESGISVQEACRFFNITAGDVVVVHDDIELPFGEVRLQMGGGLGGHNGLRSVRQHLGTDAFRRLRIGVGRPPAVIQVSDYVLGRFSPSEESSLDRIMDEAAGKLKGLMGL